MQKALAHQRAKARARLKSRPARAANDNVVHLAPPLELAAGDVVHEDAEEAPFLPPPVDDIFGLGECEEEDTVFVAPDAAEDAPFDPPEFEDEPVFSAPPSAQLVEPPAPAKPEPKPLPPPQRERPLPAISVYASWDRPEAEAMLNTLSRDPRMGRAEMRIARGGLDGAIAYCEAREAPDLVIFDTNLQGSAILQSLDRLRVAAPRAAIVVLGAVNDITLLRELAARGVSDYIVPPATADDLASSLCRLFADAAPARVIAVIGARGGVGASTIAHNIAWSIAERQQVRTTLADLDLSFGAAAFNFQLTSKTSIADVLRAGDDAEPTLAQALTELTPRLHFICAPDRVECADIESTAFSCAMAEMRRASTYVVIDLPHVWEPWVREALKEADEVVIVAAPDLASLRNIDNMLKLLRSERDKASAPLVVLSMAGVPKRPEIPLKDFATAIHVQPAMTFAFEPDLFGRATMNGLSLYEVMPDSKAALQLDTLASLLTGREATAKPAPRLKPQAIEAPQAASQSQAPASQSPPPVHEELPVLDLIVEVQATQIPRAKRRVARTGFLALQEPAPRRPRRSTGLLRMAALVALVIAGAWFVQQQRTSVDAAPPHSMQAISA